MGAILDLGRPGAWIGRESRKNVSRLIPHGFHTAGPVFSTEMDAGTSQLSPASGFLKKVALEAEIFDF